jgi:hypothetical protein
MADDILSNPPQEAFCIADSEATRGQLRNLKEIIAGWRELMNSLPESEIRTNLLDEISALDSIADDVRQALDSIRR